LLPRGRIGADIEGAPGTKAYDRHRIAGRWDRASQHLRVQKSAGINAVYAPSAPPNSWSNASRRYRA
jgi:hypothetical protein